MIDTAGDPVASGQRYIVSEVAGHRPAGLGDFAGATAFTLIKDGRPRQIPLETRGTAHGARGTVRRSRDHFGRTTG